MPYSTGQHEKTMVSSSTRIAAFVRREGGKIHHGRRKVVFCIDGDSHLLLEGVRSTLAQGFSEARFLTCGEKADKVLLILCVAHPQNAVAFIQKCQGLYQELKTILLYDDADPEDPLSFLALGYYAIRKTRLSASELLECVQMLKRGLYLWEEDWSIRLLKEAERYHVFLETARREVCVSAPTERELEIAQGILHGLGNEEIGQQLFISTGTVKNNIASILEKYGFRSRTQIISLLAL